MRIGYVNPEYGAKRIIIGKCPDAEYVRVRSFKSLGDRSKGKFGLLPTGTLQPYYFIGWFVWGLSRVDMFHFWNNIALSPCRKPYSFARICWLRGLFWFSLGVYLRWNPIRVPVAKESTAWGKGALALLAVGPWFAGGMISLFAVWSLMPDAQWPKWMTGISFPIFLLHSAFITWLTGIYRFSGIKEFAQNSAVMYVITVFLVIGLSGAAAIAIKKIPKVGCWVFGGR